MEAAARRDGERLKAALPIFITLLVILTVLASFLWRGELWGVASWGWLSPFISLVLAVLFVPQLFLKAPVDPFRRIRGFRPRALELVVTAAAALLVLWLLRARQDLWGERHTLARSIETGYRWYAPLPSLLCWALYRLMNTVFLWGARSVIALVSIVSGALFVLAAIRAARVVQPGGAGAGSTAVSTAVLLANGFVVVFLGGGGPVALASLFVLLFMIAEVELLRGERSPALPTLWLALAVLSHASAIFLIPGYLYGAVRGMRTPAARVRSEAALAVLVAVALAVELAASRITGRPGPASELFVVSAASLGGLARLGPRLGADARDGISAFLIIGPASALALFHFFAGAPRLARGAAHPGERPVALFMTVAAISAFAAAVALAGRVDGGLGWWAAAATGPALAIYVLWALGAFNPDAAGFAKAALLCAGLGLFQTAPWIAVNALPPAAEKRFLSLPLSPGRSELIVARADSAAGELDAAHRWYIAAIAKDSLSLAADLGAAAIEMKTEEYPAAITHYGNAHDMRPDDPRYQELLAEALIANRWFPEAIGNLEQLTARYPDSVRFWRRLGFASNNSGRYAAAVEAYRRALDLEPGKDENLRNLVSALLNRAAELQRDKKYAEAEAMYRQVIGMYPEDWHAYNNLATVYMRQGDYKKARSILESAVRVHPYESSLHFNLGIVYDKLGETRKALDEMITARDLDPMYSAAPSHIERLERKLGIWRPESPDSIRNPFLKP
jgi:tetratricopeptide (TPR) repeat protein